MKYKTIMLLLSSLILSPTLWADDTPKGNPEKGKDFYEICSGCHGLSGEGNPALQAPRLAGQYDWYIVKQLMNFKAGLRGSAEGDNAGAMMLPMASTLPDEQAVHDVAAYITTFN